MINIAATIRQELQIAMELQDIRHIFGGGES
jgi:hypothetical protein